MGLAVGAVAALGFAVTADAAPQPYKVTGGGQTFVDYDPEEGVKGPGNTITFQAFIPGQGVQEDSTGQVNIIDRRASENGKGDHFRGTVDCTFLASDPAGGGYVELIGHGIKDDVERDFVVRIQDNGQGAAADNDLVEFDLAVQDPQCEEQREDEEDSPDFTLARGNAKIHKQSPSKSSSQGSASTSTAKSTSTSSLTSVLSLR